LRAALREEKRRREPVDPGTEMYPELEATFQVPPTRLDPSRPAQPGTELMSTVTAAAAPASRRGWLWGGGALLAASAVAGALLLRGGGNPVPVAAHLEVRSQPMGAAVLVDGRDTGVVTNGEIVLPSPSPAEVVLTFRKAGHRDETRRVRLPRAAGEPVSVTLAAAASLVAVRTQPPGATVTVDGERVSGLTPLEVALDPGVEHRVAFSLEGHETREVRVEAGAAGAPIDVVLEKQPPPGTVAVESSYPLDVLWRGRALARGEPSPRVEVAGGRQVLTLVSSAVFLKADVTVQVRPGGQVALAAPPLGKLNVRAVPDNCEIFVNGAFVDYPPILDRPAAAGRLVVSFRWPDGARSEQAVEVKGGTPAFVVGRKE
jgi:hypothetical protein